MEQLVCGRISSATKRVDENIWLGQGHARGFTQWSLVSSSNSSVGSTKDLHHDNVRAGWACPADFLYNKTNDGISYMFIFYFSN